MKIHKISVVHPCGHKWRWIINCLDDKQEDTKIARHVLTASSCPACHDEAKCHYNQIVILELNIVAVPERPDTHPNNKVEV